MPGVRKRWRWLSRGEGGGEEVIFYYVCCVEEEGKERGRGVRVGGFVADVVVCETCGTGPGGPPGAPVPPAARGIEHVEEGGL